MSENKILFYGDSGPSAESYIIDKENHKLFEDLQTRMLTDEEYIRVLKLDTALVTCAWQSYDESVARRKVDMALLIQARLREINNKGY